MPTLKKRHLTLKILLFLAGIDLLETFAQFCFKKSALVGVNFQVRNIIDAFMFIKAVIPSVYLWLGLVSVLVIFISWSTILSKIDLSVAVPVCSFSYITVPLVSMFLFHEKISLTRWTGIFMILIGVMLVSISSTHRVQCA